MRIDPKSLLHLFLLCVLPDAELRGFGLPSDSYAQDL
jgi:hypothetical protein